MRRIALVVCLCLTACPPEPPENDAGTLAPKPTLDSLAPTKGGTSGGTVVTLTGTGFVDGATVKFADTEGQVVAVDSALRLRVKTPAVTKPGAVSVTLTNPDGQSASLANAFTYESNVAVTEAVLLNAATANDVSGATTVTIPVSAAVEVPGVTKGAGAGPNVKAQVGFTRVLDRLPTDAETTWRDATYTADGDGAVAGDLARDVYRASVELPGLGTEAMKEYALLARFSTNGGATWTLADRDGAANGTTASQLSRVKLSSLSINWCKLGGVNVEPPPMLTVKTGATAPIIYGQVYVPEVTNQAGAGAGIRGQLGVGAPGSMAATWTWTDATFNTDTSNGANDEFQAPLQIPAVGMYVFAFRFSRDGMNWAYCDADGLANEFTANQLGQLTVTEARVDSCVLQFPTALDTREGRSAPLVYGRVFAQGLTDQTAPSTTLAMEFGYGVGAMTSSWTWSPATFNVKVMGGGEEFQARTLGPDAGTYSYAYRARVGAGPWDLCDLDGSGNGFSAAQAGTLNAKRFDLDDCTLDGPTSTQATIPSGETMNVLGRVRALTLTEAADAGAGVAMEVGYGPTGTQPSTWLTWRAASFDGDDGVSDRYRATITAPAGAGSYDVAYRARLGTNPIQYCDKDGAANGYTAAQAGRLTVTAPAISRCTLQFVSATSVASGNPVTGFVRVMIPGVTAMAGATANLQTEFGLGSQGVDARSSPEWGWRAGTFNVDVASGEDEFKATFNPAYVGTRAVSARARLNGGAWTYCDSDGSDNGYTVSNQWSLAVTPHVEFPFCNTQFPTTAAPGSGATIYGRVFRAGVTPDGGAPITAELGVGAKVEDPGAAWSWSRGTFNVVVGNDNEYRAALPLDAGAGKSYAWRFTFGDAGTYCFGDLDGSQNGFTGEVGITPNLGSVQ